MRLVMGIFDLEQSAGAARRLVARSTPCLVHPQCHVCGRCIKRIAEMEAGLLELERIEGRVNQSRPQFGRQFLMQVCTALILFMHMLDSRAQLPHLSTDTVTLLYFIFISRT
jgi:hypothetical protein